ncbi:hypothetical protein [Streptomyces sp. NPDC088725]|uniref:hypothetical protein n=1 Tax=Streptomyces sp. NPDC088725 TaxID=3365873 RepID=UPI0038261F29
MTARAWTRAGPAVPRTGQEQWSALPQVPLRELRPGDLVVHFPKATHVAVHLGCGRVVRAPRPGARTGLTDRGGPAARRRTSGPGGRAPRVVRAAHAAPGSHGRLGPLGRTALPGSGGPSLRARTGRNAEQPLSVRPGRRATRYAAPDASARYAFVFSGS